MSRKQIDCKWDISNGIQLRRGSTHSNRGQQGHTIETTGQGGNRDGPNNLVWLHMKYSGAALSALELRQALIDQLGAIGS